jgi:twitching motility protein PilT
MQHFDGEIEKLIRARTIDFESGMAYATNPGNLRLELADLRNESPAEGLSELGSEPACPK